MEERSTETIRNAYKGNIKHGKSEAIAPKWMLQSTEAVMQYYLDRDLTLDRCVLEKFPLPQEGHNICCMRIFLSVKRFVPIAPSIDSFSKNTRPANTL